MATKSIISFFNELRNHGGAMWLQNDVVNASVPKAFQNDRTKQFIEDNKAHICSVLQENKILSSDIFQKIKILKDSSIDEYPLSFAQQRLWFIDQYEKTTNAYHIPSVFELENIVDITALQFAIQQVVARHEILRTKIVLNTEQEPIQIVCNESLTFQSEEFDEEDKRDRCLNDDINRPFDLQNEFPIRVKFYIVISKADDRKVTKSTRVMLINLHHIAADAWSLAILKQELSQYYHACIRKTNQFTLPDLVVQYKDFARWQRSYLTDAILEDQLAFWKGKLSNYSNLDLPTDFPRPNAITYQGASVDFILTAEQRNLLYEFAKNQGTTAHSVLLSAVSVFLNKYTGQDDIIVGGPIANRQSEQTRGMIGLFLNTLPMRVNLNDVENFATLVKRVHVNQIEIQTNQDLPFEKLVEEIAVERDISRHPIFQVAFVFQSAGQETNASHDINNYLRPFQGKALYNIEKFDLSMYFQDHGNEVAGRISYATSLFAKETITRYAENFKHLFEQLLAVPNQKYSDIAILPAADHRKIVFDWNNNFQYSAPLRPVYKIIEEQALRNASKIAVCYEGTALTYHELNEKSNQLARHIQQEYQARYEAKFTAGTLVALCTEKSIEMMIGILAIHKSGGAYVPIDPAHPLDRINFVLQDTSTLLVLTQNKVLKNVQLPEEKVLCIDNDKLYKNTEASNLEELAGERDLAYVIYTSGTSGRPKGVMIEHRSLSNLIQSQKHICQIDDSTRVLQFASLVFDASVWEIFTALSYGATLFILPSELRSEAALLKEYLVDHQISLALLPPALLATISPDGLPNLKSLVVGGESTPAEVM
jgi:non-ribosomal peptide synthetase component F